ncbi:MAG TPA: hypothetical protein VHV30_11430, partial [Polyangiaceae bacterium]|jgi:NADPH:quinone reductase-like Zn-dependent oxidoreductase|nr:hypothetical protein [Polyangiaceae bacterium]
MTLPATGVAPRPRSLSFALCAASGVPYTTALNGLERTAVTAGTRVLVIGLGAVGKAAVDIARWMGARVACAVRRDEHLAYLARRDVPSVRLGEPEAFANAAREPFADAFDAGALPAPPEPAIIPFEAALPAYGEVHGGRPDKVVFAMGGA